MITDGRVIQAREYLTAARRHEVTELPPSVLLRELAEARRVIGRLLTLADDYEDDERQREASHLEPSGAAYLVPPDVLVLGEALSDAVAYRAPDTCRDCTSGLLCGDADDDMRRRHAYQDLAATLRLGIEP